jgi:hypothetical protein
MSVEEIAKAIESTPTKTAAEYVAQMLAGEDDWREQARDFVRMDEDLHLLAGRVVELEAEMAKFELCKSSNGCRDEEGMVHTVRQTPGSALRSARVRKVYHRAGE